VIKKLARKLMIVDNHHYFGKEMPTLQQRAATKELFGLVRSQKQEDDVSKRLNALFEDGNIVFNTTDLDGATILHIAVSREVSQSIGPILLAMGEQAEALMHLKNKDGQTAAELAAPPE
jgi:hypothetical protein